MVTNLKVSKTNKAIANLATPFTPFTPQTPWGVSPQAKRLLSSYILSSTSISHLGARWGRRVMLSIKPKVVEP